MSVIYSRLSAALSMRSLFGAFILPVICLSLPPAIPAADLSVYRGFRLGVSLPAAVKHSGMDASEITVLHKRPAKIEELAWDPGRFSRTARENDPVRQVVLHFFNGQLFRMTVEYDVQRTEGMSVQDLIDSASEQYGSTSTTPIQAAPFPLGSSHAVSTVVARWEDAGSSVSLVQESNGSAFGLIVSSRKLDGLAQAAIVSGTNQDEQEEPARLRQIGQDTKDKLDRARLTNRANFRP